MASSEDDAAGLYRTLTAQTLVAVFIGPRTETQEPVYLQEAILRQASEYFAKALDNEHLGGEDDRGKLRFEHDDTDVWEILLFWMFHRRLPSKYVQSKQKAYDELHLLCRTWMAADRYLMVELQDLIMLELIWITCAADEGPEKEVDLDLVQLVFHGTAPDSGLRRLIAEELVWTVEDRKDISCADMIALDGATNVAGAIAHAYQAYNKDQLLQEDWLSESRLKEFMVGDGPSTHWLFDSKPAEDEHEPKE